MMQSRLGLRQHQCHSCPKVTSELHHHWVPVTGAEMGTNTEGSAQATLPCNGGGMCLPTCCTSLDQDVGVVCLVVWRLLLPPVGLLLAHMHCVDKTV